MVWCCVPNGSSDASSSNQATMSQALVGIDKSRVDGVDLVAFDRFD